MSQTEQSHNYNSENRTDGNTFSRNESDSRLCAVGSAVLPLRPPLMTRTENSIRPSSPRTPISTITPDHGSALPTTCTTSDVPTPSISYNRASFCGCLLHPGCPLQDMDECPVCKVDELLRTVNDVAAKWAAVGGPTPKPPVHMNYSYYRRRYCDEKRELMKFLCVVEKWADAECEWEEKNREFIQQYGGSIRANSAQEAFCNAKAEDPHLDQTTDKHEEAKPPNPVRKRVTFDPGTLSPTGRHLSTFKRSSYQYKPGRYQSPADGWEDTSFFFDQMHGVEPEELETFNLSFRKRQKTDPYSVCTGADDDEDAYQYSHEKSMRDSEDEEDEEELGDEELEDEEEEDDAAFDNSLVSLPRTPAELQAAMTVIDPHFPSTLELTVGPDLTELISLEKPEWPNTNQELGSLLAHITGSQIERMQARLHPQMGWHVSGVL